MQRPTRRRNRLIATAGLGIALLTVAACSSGSKSNSSGTTATVVSGPVKCGAGTGQKATGSPIKLGAIVTKAPGVDFDDAPSGLQAYYQCVNDNGGINGHPVSLVVENDQIDPGQVASLGRKLVGSDAVVGIVGSFSIIECDVNHSYYESQNLYALNYGIAPSCWTTPNSATATIGPRFSVDGVVQALIKQGAKKIVLDEPKNAVTDFITAGATAVAAKAGVPIQTFTDTPPIQDANSIAVKLVQAAGKDGAVILNYVPSAAQPILQAAQQQGLQSRVKWGCSLPCNNIALAKSLGSAWNNKLTVATDFSLPTAAGTDNDNYRQVLGKYAPKLSLNSFSQAGYFMAKLSVDRLLSIKGTVTRANFNAAMKATDAYKSDMLCGPFSYGSGSAHIPVNTFRTVTFKDGQVVPLSDCEDVSSADPLIAKIRQ